MSIILMILRSRLGQIALAIIAGVLIYNIWVHVLHTQWAAAEKGKAAVEVLEKTKEVQEDVKKREEKVDRMEPDGLIDYWGGDRMQPDNPKGGPAAPPR
jgi:hypothetical protein